MHQHQPAWEQSTLELRGSLGRVSIPTFGSNLCLHVPDIQFPWCSEISNRLRKPWASSFLFTVYFYMTCVRKADLHHKTDFHKGCSLPIFLYHIIVSWLSADGSQLSRHALLPRMQSIIEWLGSRQPWAFIIENCVGQFHQSKTCRNIHCMFLKSAKPKTKYRL